MPIWRLLSRLRLGCVYIHRHSAFDILYRRLRFGLRVLELCSFIAHPVSLSSTQEFRASDFPFKKKIPFRFRFIITSKVEFDEIAIKKIISKENHENCHCFSNESKLPLD